MTHCFTAMSLTTEDIILKQTQTRKYTSKRLAQCVWKLLISAACLSCASADGSADVLLPSTMYHLAYSAVCEYTLSLCEWKRTTGRNHGHHKGEHVDRWVNCAKILFDISLKTEIGTVNMQTQRLFGDWMSGKPQWLRKREQWMYTRCPFRSAQKIQLSNPNSSEIIFKQSRTFFCPSASDILTVTPSGVNGDEWRSSGTVRPSTSRPRDRLDNWIMSDWRPMPVVASLPPESEDFNGRLLQWGLIQFWKKAISSMEQGHKCS